MVSIGKNRCSVDATDESLSMLQCNTLDALQPPIAEHGQASRIRRDTTSPPPMPATQLGTEKGAATVEAHSSVEELEEVRSKSEATVKNSSCPVRATTKRRAHG
jgi:hypothetical protein